jgi:hypothetical protein
LRLRLSRAKYNYQCDKCSRPIRKAQEYYRLEPHPMARVHRGEKVERLCLGCVHGQKFASKLEEDRRNWLRNYWIRDRSQDVQDEQPPLELQEPVTLVKTQIYIASITPELLSVLLANPDEISNLTPELFEELVCDRFQAMGYVVERVGEHTFRKDGGIDIVATQERATFPFLIAIQAKHHRSPKKKTGPGPVRELLGVVDTHLFNAGILVTNTTFTPDARWIAEQRSMLVRLRDIYDIERWLANNFLDECDWREMPDEIVVCPGVVVHIPKPRVLRP